MGGKTEFLYCNVKILLYHHPNLFNDEWSRESDEGVSAWGIFIHLPRFFGVNDSKGKNQLKKKGYLHRWLITLNGIQDGTPYAGRPVGNSTKPMPLDNLLNRDILHSLRMHSVLIRCILDGEETYEEERNKCFS